MTWREFYYGFTEDKSIRSSINELTEVGENREILNWISGNEVNDAGALLRKVQKLGAVLEPEEIIEAADYISRKVLLETVKTTVAAGKPFSEDDLYNLSMYLSDSEITELDNSAEMISARINKLVRSGNHRDILDWIGENDTHADALMKKASECGIAFAPREVVEAADYVSHEVLTEIAKTTVSAGERFSEQQLSELEYYLSEYEIDKLRYRGSVTEEKTAASETESNIEFFDNAKKYTNNRTERKVKKSLLSRIADFLTNGGESRPQRPPLTTAQKVAAIYGASQPMFNSAPQPKFRVDDHVIVGWRGEEGRVIDVTGKNIMVRLSHGRVETYNENELTRVKF